MRRFNLRQLGLLVLTVIPSLAVATLIVWWLQDVLGVPNPSAVYLIAVVVCALATGTLGAVVAAVGSFLAYDFLFVEPRGTLTINDPAEYLGLILLLFVGVVVGQLAAIQRSRTEVARAREREARALFRLSRALATRESSATVLPEIAQILSSETELARVWFTIGPDDASERLSADSADGPRPPLPTAVNVLRRMPGDEPAEWVRVRTPTLTTRQVPSSDFDVYRVRVEAQGQRLGSVWALRRRGVPELDRTETRLLAAAADQIGQVLAHDRLAAESQAAEIARQSDELKSALLQSVSHDLRTPLATIRAAAGTLRPSVELSNEEQNESVDAIDREVEYLNRIVTNLLDLSRIEAGALQAERDVFELDDLLRTSLERQRPRLTGRQFDVDITGTPVEVDPIFLDEAFTNIIENALKYTPPGTRVRVQTHEDEPGWVRLTVDDAGPGVPDDALPKLFEKFYRVPGRSGGSRSGTGIGLAVVRGLVEAMGGRVAARRGELGGLAIDLDLPAAAGSRRQPMSPA